VNDARAILLTGAFGTGKSTVAEEIAHLLEGMGLSYAAIDLDWLCWSNATGADHSEHGILVQNLEAVVSVYRQARVERFVLAGAVADAPTLDALRAAIGVPVLTVRLTAPLAVIEQRLGAAPTRGRAEDLERAREWVTAGTGVGLEDGTVQNAGSLREAAIRVLDLAGWLPS